MKPTSIEGAWQQLQQDYNLSAHQMAQFNTYFQELLATNELHNLTAITNPVAVIFDHFYDSLALSKVMDLTKVRGIADVGSGGGFPGIPLKIMYPELPVVLIEVTVKKVQFLERMCDLLEFDLITVYSLDWRTFLRTTEFNVDLFCARASLQLDELGRMFKPGCVYHDAKLVYWASKEWDLSLLPANLHSHVFSYNVGRKERQLVEITR
jgi:16S rRNA (guanine527-N7)-methyltransferase